MNKKQANKQKLSSPKKSKPFQSNTTKTKNSAIHKKTALKPNSSSLLNTITAHLLDDTYAFKQWTIIDLGELRHDLLIAHYDKNKERKIIWANESKGTNGKFNQPVSFEQIKSRVEKDNVEQTNRSKDNAEVYTPFWICNLQNDLVDQDWFKKDTFITGLPIKFKTPLKAKKWLEYVKLNRMEITCGEAPYLVSRYDVTKETKLIHPNYRTGLLDRKIRVINSFAKNNELNEDEWHQVIKKCYQSIYGFEYQGDSLFLARCNLLLTYIDYYQEYFQKDFDITKQKNIDKLKEIAYIICWNIWQMDGITNSIPDKQSKKTRKLTNQEDDCNKEGFMQMKFNFDKANNSLIEKSEHKNNHCYILDWEANTPICFNELLNNK